MDEPAIRILLIDDDEDDFVLTRDLLAEIPDGRFHLDWAPEPADALERMRRGGYDLYLVDYSMGRIDGLALIRDAAAGGCAGPFILLTGMDERAIDLGAMRAGAADFLEKWRLTSTILERSIRYSLQEKQHADDLERRVRERTAELARANEALQAEVVERGRAEEALRAADRRKDEFLSMLAHELRNPLVPIRNALEIMRLAAHDPETIETSRAMIDRQVQHLVRLIDDLVQVARMSRGLIKLIRGPVPVGSVVASAVESVRPHVTKYRHDLAVTVPDDSIVLDADSARISQVLYCMLLNSVKNTPPGGKIELTAERDGDDAVFRVKDDGVGIPEEWLEKIFEKFTQVKREGAVASGLGIGLSLVKALVELHGGSVHALSDGPGRGSEFVVRLPIENATDRAA